MALSANLGFPRIGAKRELKKTVEAYWKGNLSKENLEQTAKEIRAKNWHYQKDAGIDHIPGNDFSLYDQVLDMIALVGAVPDRYKHSGGNVSLDTYFAMARGAQTQTLDVKAMEMTKWFDTNYHFIVPEFTKNQSFALSSDKIFNEFDEAKALGIETRPVIIGPVSFLLLGKTHEAEFNTLDLLDSLLPIYSQILDKLKAQGASWVQIDEPFLAMDISDQAKQAFAKAYDVLKDAGLHIQVSSYFAGLEDNLAVAAALPVQALHIDAVRAPEQVDSVINAIADKDMKLSIGVVDGRNIWKNNFATSLDILQKAQSALGNDRVIVSPSCSLLHSPVSLGAEEALDDELKSWLAFAEQKIDEIAVLTKALNEGTDAVADAWQENKAAHDNRKTSTRIHNPEVKERAKAITDAMYQRHANFDQRKQLQRQQLGLPHFPITTIGSFPQTQEVRQHRAQFKKGDLSAADYDAFLKEETTRCIRFQEDLDIDVLVHGEFERNDMVEYFGEQLSGYAFTEFGWVQSYGSRCVKPPIIFGDVSRPAPMSIDWISFAQQQTKRHMKGMLTGPVTMLQWSFVRDDQPRSETCKQIGLAIRDEVVDLEKAGIKIIQIDEPAMREGLPLRHTQWKEYLTWAVASFRLTASGVEDKTQIHTHMCYSEFNDIIESVADMDADVISIETSRSQMELLDAFIDFKYPNEIGPGVYDIHSPRVPSQEEMEELLKLAAKRLNPEQIWVNPDCGLKTRGWTEVESSLKAMVTATKSIRKDLENGTLAQAS